MDSDLRLYEVEDFAGFERLGAGSFSTVFGANLVVRRGRGSCSSLDGKDCGEHDEDSLPQLGSDSSLDSSVTSSSEEEGTSQPGTFALKTLSLKKLKTLRKLQGAARDLMNEVEVLCALPFHPNIIQMYGISGDFLTSPETGFLVLERLQESLTQVLKKWKQERNTADFFSLSSSLATSTDRSPRCLQAQRIQKVALDLANAMGFLHDERILYRDLKPANCGFDKDGTLRLFDFGLAKQMYVNVHRRPTGRIGTLRYMAPEVALSEEYSYPADVHSFGMLLYEICVLECPFQDAATVDSLTAMVTNKSFTPPVNGIASPLIQHLLEMCWSPDPGDRPDFDSIAEQLKTEMSCCEPQEESCEPTLVCI